MEPKFEALTIEKPENNFFDSIEEIQEQKAKEREAEEKELKELAQDVEGEINPLSEEKASGLFEKIRENKKLVRSLILVAGISFFSSLAKTEQAQAKEATVGDVLKGMGVPDVFDRDGDVDPGKVIDVAIKIEEQKQKEKQKEIERQMEEAEKREDATIDWDDEYDCLNYDRIFSQKYDNVVINKERDPRRKENVRLVFWENNHRPKEESLRYTVVSIEKPSKKYDYVRMEIIRFEGEGGKYIVLLSDKINDRTRVTEEDRAGIENQAKDLMEREIEAIKEQRKDKVEEFAG